MVRRSFVAFALCAAFAAGAHAQSRQAVIDLVRKGDLRSAIAAAKAATTVKTADASDFQVHGILLAADGQMKNALTAFQEGLKRAQRQDAVTGLETLPPNSVLAHKLSVVKGIYAISNGEAAFRNNIGLTQLILGKMKDGFDQLSAVHQLAPMFGAAYVNDAVGHLLKREGSKAVSSAKRAMDLGEKSVMARTVLAEGDIIVNRLHDASDQLKAALEEQPEHPLALAARAKFASVTGDERGAQRYRTKALAGGAPVAVDGAIEPSYTAGKLSGGSAQEKHYGIDQRLFQEDPTGLGVTFFQDGERVQNRADAYQSLANGKVEVASPIGSLHLDYKDLNGGRPGTETFEPGVTSDPSAILGFKQSNIYGNLNLGPVVLHAGYRTATTNLADATSPSAAHNNDNQIFGEARYDLVKWGGKSSLGFAYTRLNRTLTNQLVIDPTEELLPNGRSDLWTAYLLHTRDLTPLIRLRFGGMIGRNGVAVIGEPYFDLSLHLGAMNIMHLGVSAMFNSDVSDLMPDELRAAPVIENQIDRSTDTTTPYNQSPVLIPQHGRQRSYELGVDSSVSPALSLHSAIYHHELKDVAVQGTDPQTATFLNQNQLSSGNATGVSETARIRTGRNTDIRAKVYAQHTGMTPQTTAYNGNSPGAPPPLDLPFAPGLGLDLGFGWHGSDWTSTLVASTLGKRTVATGVLLPNGLPCCSYIQVVNPVTSWNLFLHRQFGPAIVYFSIYNITRVSFYPGEQGRTTVVFGFQL
ncbi:MAG TPA: hypothetical protein VKT78_17355 [Fimbriimonadaceae bacterium]|nr:hypothetical protein [Fimbriimonadaceae bacterium]